MIFDRNLDFDQDEGGEPGRQKEKEEMRGEVFEAEMDRGIR